ncbi:hypothetical protein [Mycobacteroides abscessus]|uniref:Uncharacterized protein n=1 Tax=Mycobacteroides abscessus TaxID=36809 RepID=A0A0U0ZR46_9MYCO|nr:hypothetical protein [Mycobacteroides abscessus]CPV66416.1 Uncharacterised protein [Mycobacteroides abscessus]
MITLGEAETLTGKSVLEHLDREADVPQVSKAAAQGDVLVLRVETDNVDTPMPQTVVVVQSEASTNTHTLHPSGNCFWEASDQALLSGTTDAGLVLGKLTIPEGSTALLSHQEHGALEILPGTYEIRRQREFAESWRMVSD